MRLLIKDLLHAIDVEDVQTANNGIQAFHDLRHYLADIAIIDWVMRPTNGLELLDRIRNDTDSPNPYLPIIMLTAYSQIERVEQCRDAGVTEFLSKPITPKTLYSRLVSVIEDQRQYVRCETYFGPDRRRADRPYVGEDRRYSGEVLDLD